MASPKLAVLAGGRAAKGATIVCDRGCGAERQVPPGQAVADLEESLRAQGWLIRDRVDVCPDCRVR